MKPLKEIYGKSFFSKRYRLHWRASHVCKAIDDVLHPNSVIDIGCATGDLVKCWKDDFGIGAYGVEGSPEANEFFVTDGIYNWDCRTLWPKPRFELDLVTCFEVAEHIEPEYASMFVANLTNLADRILISAAPPGQGGHYHVNCRPFEYWKYLFGSFNFQYIYSITKQIKTALEPWGEKDGIRAFYWNLAYFERSENEPNTT